MDANTIQFGMLPMQMGLKCISTALRGTAPAVLAISTLAAGATVLGAIKGIDAIKKAADKPKAGQNKASKIHKEVDGQKGAKIHAFEMDAKYYEIFEIKAKQLGVAYAAVKSDDGKVHIITNNKNESLTNALLSSSETMTQAKTPPEVSPEPSADIFDQALKDHVEAGAYKEVPFEESKWSQILQAAKEYIMTQVLGIRGVNVIETSNGTELDCAPEAKAELKTKLQESLKSIGQMFSKEQLDGIKNSLKSDTELPDIQDTPELSAFAERALDPNARNEVKVRIEKVDAGQYPEIRELATIAASQYLKADTVPTTEELRVSLSKINDDFKQTGIAVRYSLDDHNKITAIVDPQEISRTIEKAREFKEIAVSKKFELSPRDAASAAMKAIQTEYAQERAKSAAKTPVVPFSPPQPQNTTPLPPLMQNRRVKF